MFYNKINDINNLKVVYVWNNIFTDKIYKSLDARISGKWIHGYICRICNTDEYRFYESEILEKHNWDGQTIDININEFITLDKLGIILSSV